MNPDDTLLVYAMVMAMLGAALTVPPLLTSTAENHRTRVVAGLTLMFACLVMLTFWAV